MKYFFGKNYHALIDYRIRSIITNIMLIMLSFLCEIFNPKYISYTYIAKNIPINDFAFAVR